MNNYIKTLFTQSTIIKDEDLNYILSHISPFDLLSQLEETFHLSSDLNLYRLYTNKFPIETICPTCECHKIYEMSYLDLGFYFYGSLDCQCEVCNRKYPTSKENKCLENTFFYIEKFLNPRHKWPEYYPVVLKLKELINPNINKKAVKDYLVSLSYPDFLQTLYWRAISSYKIKQSFLRCEKCKGYGKLEVHHKTYKHHGEELDYLEDLMVLCRDCHNNIHKSLATKT